MIIVCVEEKDSIFDLKLNLIIFTFLSYKLAQFQMDELLDDISVDVKYNNQNYVLCTNYYQDISNLSVSYDKDTKGYQMRGVVKFTFLNTSDFSNKSRPSGFDWLVLLNQQLCEFFNIKNTILVDIYNNNNFLSVVKVEDYQVVYDMSPTFCKMILKENP